MCYANQFLAADSLVAKYYSFVGSWQSSKYARKFAKLNGGYDGVY